MNTSNVFSIRTSVFTMAINGLRTVEACNSVTYEIVTKPAFEPKRKVEFLTLLRFIIQCTVVVVAIALLSCVLAVLNIMSVFAVSTALEDFPVSEILLAER